MLTLITMGAVGGFILLLAIAKPGLTVALGLVVLGFNHPEAAFVATLATIGIYIALRSRKDNSIDA